MYEPLDLGSLRRALTQLRAGYAAASAEPDNELARDGTIQRFEYTYELAHKMLRRYLRLSEPDPQAIDRLSFPDLIRLGCERGLVQGDLEQWFTYRSARGSTSHAYDAEIARAVFQTVPALISETQTLLDRLSVHLSS